MNEIEYIEWSKEVPFLAAMPKKNPFTVPGSYFNNAFNETTTQFSLAMYKGKNAGDGFLVPEDYFTMLTGQILSRVQAEKFRSDSTGFALPDGYFESLTGKILEKTVETPKEAKVIKLWHSDLMKYASAACVLLVTAATLFFHQQQFKLDQTSTSNLYQASAAEYNEQMLYDIDEEVIIEHIQASSNSNKHDVASMPAAQLENYILDNYSSRDIEQGL